MIAESQPLTAAPKRSTLGYVMAILGFLLFAGGALLSPERVAPALLLGGYLLLGAGVGGLYFLAIHYAAGAGWATALKRIPEALVSLLPAAALVILVAVFAGGSSLYPWLHGGAETVAFSPFKAWWLHPPFFFARTVVYLGILLTFGWALRRHSLAQDRDGDRTHTAACRKISAAFLVVGSFTVWLASFDWIMALEPHWYSTMFGVYSFAGHFTSSLAVVILLVVWMVRRGALPGVGEDHLHDLGKLLFAMCTFWMYIWFSQAMLIWYTNLAEEAVYYNLRLSGGWRTLFIANVFLNWVIPFLVLLSRPAKRSAVVLPRVAMVVLVGHALDLYLMIYPPRMEGGGPAFGVVEVGAGLIAVGLALILLLRRLDQVPHQPLGDPYLEESLHLHQ